MAICVLNLFLGWTFFMEATRPRPSQRALFRRLQDAQRRRRKNRGRKRDEAMREMLRLSRAIDQA
jgi:hypothetical protein